MAQPAVVEMEMHNVANLATLQTPLATFFPSKKRTNIIYFLRIAGTATQARGLAFPVCTHTPLSLSLSVHLSGGEEQHFQLNTDIMLILKIYMQV